MTKIYIYVWAAFLVHSICAAQDEPGLLVGEKHSKTIGIKDTHNYSVDLKKGQFALLNIEQLKMDVKIVTYSVDGSKIEEFDSLNGSSGDEMVWVDSTEDGTYGIEIIPFGEKKSQRNGNYEIELISINQDVHDHLDQVLQTLNARGKLPGFAASIVTKDSLLYQNTKGYAKVEDKTPYRLQTVQSIASISKTFIGISLMMLVEEGKLSLNTPINEILPFEVTNPYFPEKQITLRHLATHTSSINDHPIYYTKAGVLLKDLPIAITKYSKEFQKTIKMASANEDMTMVAFIKKMLTKDGEWYKKKNFLKKEPGKEWYYSNVGASLAAYIVELVSGVSYGTFVKTRILEPLKLQSAGWAVDQVNVEKLASNYTQGNLLLPELKIITYPDGGIYINSQDLGKYLMELMKGFEGEDGLISAASFHEIMKVQHEEKYGNFKGTRNGLFWWQGKDGFMGHNGGDTGVIAIMKFNPETKLGITFMSNMDPTETDESLIPFEKIWIALKRYALLLKD